jgi:hypothetical protein
MAVEVCFEGGDELVLVVGDEPVELLELPLPIADASGRKSVSASRALRIYTPTLSCGWSGMWSAGL